MAEHEGTTLEFIVSGCPDEMSDDEIDLLVDISVAGPRALNRNVRYRDRPTSTTRP